MSEKIVFRPVRCSQAKLSDPNFIREGHVYFTTDTRKIYVAHDEGLVQYGETLSFYYGQKVIEYDNTGNAPDPNVIFFIDEIENGELPEINDLILNIDGCFYRVTDMLDEQSVKTTRLTLQGSGTGGGGGGSGDVGAPSFIISAPSGTIRYFSSETKKAAIDIRGRSSDTANVIRSIECSFDKNFNSIFQSQFNLNLAMEKDHEIELTKFLDKFSSTGTKVYVRVTDDWGTQRDQTYTIYLANLLITTTTDELFGVTSNSFDYICRVGGSQGVINRILTYSVYKNDLEIESNSYELADNESGNILKTLDFSSVPHGDYTLYVSMSGEIGGLTLNSNTLIHKVLRYQDSIGQPILSALIPEVTEQYTNIPVKYLLIYGDTTKTYNMDFTLDGNLETTQQVTNNVLDKYNFNFDSTGIYNLSLKIEELGVEFKAELNIIKYSGTLPVINTDRDDLKLYLTAKGKTNNSLDKEVWKDYKNDTRQGTLTNFYYRNINGWMIDEDQVSYLKLNQGAQFEFTDFAPFTSIAPTSNGLTIELDFRVSAVQDYDASLFECLSRDNAGNIWTGFSIKGNSFNYYANGNNLITLDLVENKRIKLTYVIEPNNIDYPMCYTYLNGIRSNAYPYAANITFTDSGQKGYLRADSTYGQVDIYSVRIYSSALDASTVLNNYQASLGTLEERQTSYESNLIVDLNGDIDLRLIENDNYPLYIPYVKITGGYKAAKDMTMAEENTSNVQALPTGKKDYRSIDFEVHYPTELQNSFFKGYEDFSITTTFAEGPEYNVTNGFGLTPVTGAIMYAQGTSSLEYPVKNLRVKIKGDKIKVRPDLDPVNLICLKADYMESSGSHNTGAANFIDTAYKYIDIATPGQKHFANEKIVTCIKGHPCVVFWSPTGEEGSYKYIGKYNLNLDKATPEPFGFKYDEADEKFGYEIDENGQLVLDEKGNKINSIYCFEFLDNQIDVCNFISRADATNGTTEQEKYYSTWYDTYQNKDKETVPGWTIGFESRYPEDKADFHDADVLFELASWINDLYTIRYIDGNEEEALTRFKNEYWKYLDEDFTLAYYVITEALLMADSRVKNMMIATWGKEWRTNPKDKNDKHFGYIWYPIFYDMDTMLGLDNTGARTKNYYDEDTQEDVFNGAEYLWKFVRDGLNGVDVKANVSTFFNRMEQASGILTKSGILPYFNDNQANLANETFYNEDSIYKYIDPYRNGYQDHLNDKWIKPGTGERLYAAQGDRSMMREYFVDNRIRYLRGKHVSSSYRNGDRINFRTNYPDITEEITEIDAKQNASIRAVPPTTAFELTAFKTGFSGVQVGANADLFVERFVNNETRAIDPKAVNASGTETYILGLSNLSNVGDLSTKYIQNFNVESSLDGSANKLQVLKLGHHHKDYYNKYLANTTSIALAGFIYLEEFNLENCESFTGTIDLTDCIQIKKILLNGSSPSSLLLPSSSIINELRVPTSVKVLEIDTQEELTDDFTIGYFDYDNDVYVNDFSKLVQISIKNTPIDSYTLAKKTIVEPEVRVLTHFCFQGVDWEISNINDVVLDEDGTMIGIKVLDELLSENIYSYPGVATKAEALSGRIYINLTDTPIDEYSLYQKYNSNWPNITIEYNPENPNLQPASTINFYNSETIKGEPYYSVKSNSKVNLASLTGENSPLGEALKSPVKVSDNVYNYRFVGAWKVAASSDVNLPINTIIWQDNWEELYYEVDAAAQEQLKHEFVEGYVKKLFSTTVPKGNIGLVPIYTSYLRTYSVKLMDDNKTTVLLDVQLPWDADIESSILAMKSSNENYYRVVYNYKPYNGSEPHSRYSFKGWQSNYDKNNNPDTITFSTLSGVKVSGDFVAYAYYVLEDCRTVATDEKFFAFGTSSGYTFADGEKITGSSIYLSEYANILEGKITLPSKRNGEYIKFVKDNGFGNNKKITDVYFLEDNQYIAVLENAFASSDVENVYLPKTPYFKAIGNGSFQHCHKLKSIDIDGNGKLNDYITELGYYCFSSSNSSSMQVYINELPSHLTSIGSGAFSASSGKMNTNIIITTIPEGVSILPVYCFAHCPNVNISVFGTDTIGVGLKAIGNAALRYCGSSVTNITLLNSIEQIATSNDGNIAKEPAFAYYATNTLTQFTSSKPYGEIVNGLGEPLSSWAETGLPSDKITEIVLY